MQQTGFIRPGWNLKWVGGSPGGFEEILISKIGASSFGPRGEMNNPPGVSPMTF
jgi:hypothetical protein